MIGGAPWPGCNETLPEGIVSRRGAEGAEMEQITDLFPGVVLRSPGLREKILAKMHDSLLLQTGLAPRSRGFAVLLFFMDNFVFLIFIMAQPDGQMLSM